MKVNRDKTFDHDNDDDVHDTSIWFESLVQGIVLADEPRACLQFLGTSKLIGHLASKPVLPVPDQLVGGLNHLISSLLEGGSSESKVLQDMAVHDMHLKKLVGQGQGAQVWLQDDQ